MSGFTITAGVSFSGGFTFTEAPVENTAAWFGGGYSGSGGAFRLSSVQRITFATDTDTGTIRGPLSLARSNAGAVANTTYGWFAGGITSAGSPYAFTSLIDRITYATDTATASVRGPLSSPKYAPAGAGNTTDGWFSGGYGGPSWQAVQRITYATDTATASVRGPLNVARIGAAAAGNTTDGWFAGSSYIDTYPSQPAKSSVDRITYATDTATAVTRGPLSSPKGTFGGAGNTTNGWFGASYGGTTTVDRITYATDTATASARGPLGSSTANTGVSNDTASWWGGGYTPIYKITNATDTATASTRGSLSSSGRNTGLWMVAAGGIQ